MGVWHIYKRYLWSAYPFMVGGVKYVEHKYLT